MGLEAKLETKRQEAASKPQKPVQQQAKKKEKITRTRLDPHELFALPSRDESHEGHEERESHVQAFAVGQTVEGKDANGEWWRVRLTKRNGDGTFAVEVLDGHGTKWENIHTHNMRMETQPLEEPLAAPFALPSLLTAKATTEGPAVKVAAEPQEGLSENGDVLQSTPSAKEVPKKEKTPPPAPKKKEKKKFTKIAAGDLGFDSNNPNYF